MIRIDDREIGLEEVSAVARGAKVELSSDERWLSRMKRSREILDRSLTQGQAVYGVSTNVGNRSSVEVGRDSLDAHASQMILHHGCGVGEPLSPEHVRATAFARLVSLAKGYSAVRVCLLEAMCKLLNAGVVPVIPRLGSVGASGDLTPLSYLAAVLMGEREATFKGEVLPAREALRRAGLEPFVFAHKESLALMNGTSVMTAIAILAALKFERTVAAAEQATALCGEIMHARSQAFCPLAHKVKPHPGQVASAAAIHAAIQGSQLVDQPRQGRIIQDPYSIRCAPQVLGAARDALEWTKKALRAELNSVNDNPIVDPESEAIVFAGNFYGGHVGLTMDLLKITAATVADLCDRQLALLMDSRFNLGLSETLVGYGGNGLKGMELTTTALTALAAQRATSDSIQSRSTEVGNQDKVSMGLNASLNAAEVVTLAQQVLATHLIGLSNAARLRGEEKLSPAGKKLLEQVRERSAVLVEDRRLDRDIVALSQFIDDPSAKASPVVDRAHSADDRPAFPPLPDKGAIFIVEDGVKWSRERLLTLAERARGLVPPGPVVGICSPSAPFILSCVLALWKLGRQPLMLDPSLKSEPKAVLARYPGMGVLTDLPEPPIAGSILVTEAPGELLEPVWPASDQIAAMFFTSGSTGEPKVVTKKASQLFRQMEAELNWLGVPTCVSVFSMAPPFHILGFMYGIYLPLQGRGRTAFSPGALAAQWISEMHELRPNLVVGVPNNYRMIVSHSKGSLPDAIFFSSGAPLTPDIDRAFTERTGQTITQGYGSTETGGVAKRMGYGAFRPFPNLEWKVGEDGRLAVRSPWQENPGEWHVTDDIVTADKDGFVLLGRGDSVVKVGGKRFSTEEIVTAAQAVAGVGEAVAIAYERFGENAVALFAQAKGELNAGELREALAQKLAPFKLPRAIQILEELPRLSNGKVDRQALKKMATGE